MVVWLQGPPEREGGARKSSAVMVTSAAGAQGLQEAHEEMTMAMAEAEKVQEGDTEVQQVLVVADVDLPFVAGGSMEAVVRASVMGVGAVVAELVREKAQEGIGGAVWLRSRDLGGARKRVMQPMGTLW